MFEVLLTLLCAFAYRLRGGGWLSLSDWQYRLIWGTALLVTFIATHAFTTAAFTYAVGLWAFAYIAELIPHAYAQNMGRWATPQNKWPSFFLPDYTQVQWTAMTGTARTLNDFLQMACVALLRAVVVFSPLVLSTYMLGHQIAYAGVLRGMGILTIGQPMSYLLGWYVPLNFPSLAKRSTEWGEWFNGLVWGLAMVQL